ncbi:MAG: VWA domain-containing protein [Actinobacteria bacterium]|nr:VWA domain-containing protein [Actinomycetota bacterium]
MALAVVSGLLLAGFGVTAAPAQTVGGPLKVVLIGDSYSAGNGAGNYYGPKKCYRSSTNWAERYVYVLKASGYSVTFVNRACSGAVSDNVLNDRSMGTETKLVTLSGDRPADDREFRAELGRRGDCVSKYPDEERYDIRIEDHYYDSLTHQTTVAFACERILDAQIDAIGRDTDLVLFTMGGNDVNFAEIVEQCFAVGLRDPGDCRDNVTAARAGLPGVESAVSDILRRIRSKVRDDARVVLLSYPYLEKDPSYTLVSLLGSDRYRAGEEVRDLGDLGDIHQSSGVADANASAGEDFTFFLDEVKSHFAGHEPDGSASRRNPDRWLHEFDSRIAAEWYHFNHQGHQEVANLLAPHGVFGAGGTGEIGGDLDLVFVIDTTGSMGEDIAAVKQFSTELVDLLSERTASFRVGLVTYKDHPVSPYGGSSDYPRRTELGFTDDTSAIKDAINALTVSGGGNFPESVWSGLIEGIELPWRPGVKKVIIQLGDAPPHGSAPSYTEPVSGLTIDDVVDASIAVDPAEVYVVDVSSGGSSFAPLREVADRTGGGIYSAPTPSQVSQALADALEEALTKPFAWAGGPYVTTLGSPIVLDASGSFDVDGAIVGYEWDLNGDGTYDTPPSEQPTYTHTFTVPFDGSVAVRVTDDDGKFSVGTVRAHASSDGDEVPPDEDNCPDDPNHGQLDYDEDGIGDVCDEDPGYPTEDKEGVSELVDRDGNSHPSTVEEFRQPHWNQDSDIIDHEDVDWWGVDTDGRRLKLQLIGMSSNYDLYIHDLDGNELGSSTQPGSRSEAIDLRLAAGRYLVRIQPAAGAVGGEYRLNVTAVGR